MSKRVCAAVILIMALAPVAAQERAPQNDSIRKEELRADLYSSPAMPCAAG